MKAKFLNMTEKDAGSGFSVRTFRFEQETPYGLCVFDILAPHINSRGMNEGAKIINGPACGFSSLTLKIKVYKTTISTTWAQSDKVNDEYLLELCMYLFRHTQNDLPTFEVEIEIEPEGRNTHTDPSI